MAFLRSWDLELLRRKIKGVDPAVRCSTQVTAIEAAKDNGEKYKLTTYGWRNCVNELFRGDPRNSTYPIGAWNDFMQKYGIVEKFIEYDPESGELVDAEEQSSWNAARAAEAAEREAAAEAQRKALAVAKHEAAAARSAATEARTRAEEEQKRTLEETSPEHIGDVVGKQYVDRYLAAYEAACIVGKTYQPFTEESTADRNRLARANGLVNVLLRACASDKLAAGKDPEPCRIIGPAVWNPELLT